MCSLRVCGRSRLVNPGPREEIVAVIDLQCGVVDVVAIRKQGLHRSPALVILWPLLWVQGLCRH